MALHRRWIPPLVVGAVIAAGAVVTGAQARVELPDKTPAEVLELAAQAQVDTLSGTVESHSDLGLPALDAGPHGESNPLALLTGDHRLRVWLDGPQRQRIQVLDRLAETNLVHNGRDVWLYQSRDNTATHLTLPKPPAGESPQLPLHPEAMSPDQLAAKVLALASESTTVTVGNDVEVAGRPAYDLRLRPRTAGSLVEEVSVAVDAETGLPLRVRVEAVGQDKAAFEIAYTSLSLQRPAAEIFDFTPPPGADVEEGQALTSGGGCADDDWRSGIRPNPGGQSEQIAIRPTPGTRGEPNHPISGDWGIRTIGEGWTTVLELPAGVAAGQLPTQLSDVMQPVAGGSMLRTALLSVMVTDDDRVLIGAVTPDVLQAAAEQ